MEFAKQRDYNSISSSWLKYHSSSKVSQLDFHWYQLRLSLTQRHRAIWPDYSRLPKIFINVGDGHLSLLIWWLGLDPDRGWPGTVNSLESGQECVGLLHHGRLQWFNNYLQKNSVHAEDTRQPDFRAERKWAPEELAAQVKIGNLQQRSPVLRRTESRGISL